MNSRRFATDSRKFSNEFAHICIGMQQFCVGLRRFATDSRKSSTRFAQIRDRFATDSRIRTHDSHKFARVRDGYYTVLRVKCVSRVLHVTRCARLSGTELADGKRTRTTLASACAPPCIIPTPPTFTCALLGAQTSYSPSWFVARVPQEAC